MILAPSCKRRNFNSIPLSARIRVQDRSCWERPLGVWQERAGFNWMLGRRIAGYESAHSRQLFRHFLNTPAEVEITGNRVAVTLPKRAHNPLLLAAGCGQGSTPIPWWDGRPMVLRFR